MRTENVSKISDVQIASGAGNLERSKQDYCEPSGYLDERRSKNASLVSS